MKIPNTDPTALKRILAGLIVSCLIGSGSLMSQVTLLEEDFSSFTPGNNLPAGPTSSGIGTLSIGNNPTVQNSIGSGWPSSLYDGNYGAIDMNNDRINYHPSTEDSLLLDATFSFAVYIRTESQANWSTNGDGLRINLVARPEISSSSSGIVGAFVFGADGGVYRFGDSNDDLDTDNVFGLDKWVDVSITFDINGFNVFLDDGTSTSTISSIDFSGTVTADSALHQFETRQTGSGGTNAIQLSFVDNVLITTIPEPATVALAFGILVGVICFIRRRR